MFRFAPPFDSERRLTVVAVVVVGALASSSSFFPSNMARVAATFARCDVDVARLAKDVFLFTLGSAGFSVSLNVQTVQSTLYSIDASSILVEIWNSA